MSSKRALRRKACTDKERYDKFGAMQTAYFLSLRVRNWLVAYHCNFCGHYHVGHPNSVQRQSLIAKQKAK